MYRRFSQHVDRHLDLVIICLHQTHKKIQTVNQCQQAVKDSERERKREKEREKEREKAQ